MISGTSPQKFFEAKHANFSDFYNTIHSLCMHQKTKKGHLQLANKKSEKSRKTIASQTQPD